MLRNMEAVVRGEDDICVVHLAGIFQAGDQRVHKLINTLQGAKALTIVVIVAVNDTLVSVWELPNPAYANGL